MEQRTIEVRRDGAGFVVVVQPPDPAHPPERYETMRSAWGAAGGLRLVTGWPKVDKTGEP